MPNNGKLKKKLENFKTHTERYLFKKSTDIYNIVKRNKLLYFCKRKGKMAKVHLKKGKTRKRQGHKRGKW